MTTSSPAQVVTLTNHSGATASLPTPQFPDGFKGTTCGAALANGASCTLKIQFAPAMVGPVSDALVLPVTGKPALSLGLSGTGVSAGARGSIAINPNSVDFGVQVYGDTTSLSVKLTNTTGIPAGIQSIALSGPRESTRGSNCPAVLAAGASCTVTISFAPDSSSTYFNGTLTIAESSGKVTAVPVSGIATSDNGN